MRYQLFAILLVCCATTVAAQEFDIFDFNDFVDPRLHDATFDENGKLVQSGEAFTIVRAVTGGISDYAWRSTPTHDDVAFLHLVGSRYYRNLQSNLKLTMLQGQNDSMLPRYRLTTQLARYTMHAANTKVKEDGGDRVSGRAMLSFAIEENRIDDPSRASRRFNTEFGIEVDIANGILGGRNASGSLVWMTRTTAVPGSARAQRMQRASYYYRFNDHALTDRIQVGLNFGFGGQRTDRWQWGATRFGMHAATDLGRVGTLNFSWTPTYVPRDPIRHLTHEVAFFVDRTLMAHLSH